jgi:hypothetical protein
MRIQSALLALLWARASLAAPPDDIDLRLFETAQCPEGLDMAARGSTAEGLMLEVAVAPVEVIPRLEASYDEARVATVTVKLTNRSRDDLYFTFPDPCFLRYRVARPDGEAIQTDEMPSVCVGMVAYKRLGAGEAVTQTLDWTARRGPQRPLPPGRYAITGTLSKRWCGPRELREAVSLPAFVEVGPAR